MLLWASEHRLRFTGAEAFALNTFFTGVDSWRKSGTYIPIRDLSTRSKSALEERIKTDRKEALFGQILVPTERVIELVKGQRKASSRKFYPGYILVQMELNDETWHLVRHTPKVTGFIGSQERPVSLSDEEAEAIIQQIRRGLRNRVPSTVLKKGMMYESSMVLSPISTARSTR